MVVTRYLEATGLQPYLDKLGFALAGYSCATCVGASGPLDAALEAEIRERDLVACAVLSGNRNFESRIHPSVRAAYLASPPLVVAFALAGTVRVDLSEDPIGTDPTGVPVYLRDIWPSAADMEAVYGAATDPQAFRDVYAQGIDALNPFWAEIPAPTGVLYPWEDGSTYLKEPPFLGEEMYADRLVDVPGARVLALLGDSVTTDHISPIGAIMSTSPAGLYLQENGVAPRDFNNYGARRMNHEVMVRGAFSNQRLKNALVPGSEGGVTRHGPSGETMSIFAASGRYAAEGTPLVIVAGEEYGTGSARDWAAKATRLLGVRAVIAGSFERIHRSNLVGMGVLPCQFAPGTTAADLALDGTETIDLVGLHEGSLPRDTVTAVIHRADGTADRVPLTLRIDTLAELEYVRGGGILPYMTRDLVQDALETAVG